MLFSFLQPWITLYVVDITLQQWLPSIIRESTVLPRSCSVLCRCKLWEMDIISFLILLVSCFGHQVSSRERALSNKILKIGATTAPPFFVISTDKNGKKSYSGIVWNFMEYIRKARNCTFTVVHRQIETGNCFGNNNCTGLIGMVSRNEVDFAAG